MPKRSPNQSAESYLQGRAEILKRTKEQEAQRAKNFRRTKRIYGHARAGNQAYKLFERVAEHASNYEGGVHLSRTLKNEQPDTLGRPKKIFPVYIVTYAPYNWTYATRDVMEPLFQLGDEFGCRVHYAVRDKVAVVEFRDGGVNFKGN